MQAVPLKHLGWKQRDIATALGASEAAVSAGLAAAAWGDRTFASTEGTNLQRLPAPSGRRRWSWRRRRRGWRLRRESNPPRPARERGDGAGLLSAA
jgi:hypothetical protein